MKFARVVVGSVIAMALTIAGNAAANPVDNSQANGSDTWDVAATYTGVGSFVDFGNGKSFSITNGDFTGTLVHNGTFSGDGGYTFPTSTTSTALGMNTIYATLQIQNVSGAFNAISINDTISITMDMRVKFTTQPSNVLGNVCNTPYVTVTFNTAKTWSGYSTALYSNSDGSFIALAHDFGFSAVTGTCNGNSTTINNDFNLAPGSSAGIFFAGKINDPAIMTGT
jgi:hypothetical protein